MQGQGQGWGRKARQAQDNFKRNYQNISEEDVRRAAGQGAKKVFDMGKNPPGKLAEIWSDIKTMASMLRDWGTREYVEIPWKTLAAMAGAILYFVNPLDIIPDFIPIVGYLDDFFVITFAIQLTKDDLDKYRIWKENKLKSNDSFKDAEDANFEEVD